jgi:HSP20 family protein
MNGGKGIMSALAPNQYGKVCGTRDYSAETGGSGPVWASAVDVYETENEIVIDAQLPGIKKEELQIQLQNNLLTIKGTRHLETDENRKVLRVERSYGSFDRSFKVPGNVDQNGIKSEFSQGVLRVHLPKREEEKPRQIEINVN